MASFQFPVNARCYMLILIRMILGLAALSAGFVVFGVIGSCGGARNCETELGESLFLAFLISLPFALSALILAGRNKFLSAVYLFCVLVVSIFVFVLFFFRTTPWNLISVLADIANFRELSYLALLVGVLPSILVHLSLLCMLSLVPKHIKILLGKGEKSPPLAS